MQLPIYNKEKIQEIKNSMIKAIKISKPNINISD